MSSPPIDPPKPVRPKRVTLQDIADVAGVKKMAVSNTLNDTGRVAPATRERVKRIAQELNYIPNFAARALTAGRTGIVSVLSGPLSEPYYATMVHLLENHVNADSYNLMLMRTRKEIKEMVRATGNVAVDGAITIDMQGLVNEFRSHPAIPCVSISTLQQTFVDSVTIDLSGGVEEAMAIMLVQGRHRVAYLVTATVLETEIRGRTYLGAMMRAGLEPEIINVDTSDIDELGSRLKAYIQENGCPQALLCQNDQTAMRAFRVFKELGRRIPDDVLLVGCDGQPHMMDFDPPLSTIVQPMEEACAIAWKFLKDRIDNPGLPHQSAVIQGTLKITRSLDPRAKN